MDNITHTLAGLVLADSGLKRNTRLGTAILVIGANLPDVDGFTYFLASGIDALGFRRGWTHGVLAMAVLPLLLTGAALWWCRLTRPRDPAIPVRAGWLLTLAVIGIWSHPLLDLLNTYGVRLLMPFSGRWFYGDTLFIVDPWVWGVLVLGIVAGRMLGRRGETGAGRARTTVRAALGAAVIYVLAMAVSSRMGRSYVERHSESTALRTMVAPVPGTPFHREVIRDLGGKYEFGSLSLPPMKYALSMVESTGSQGPGISAASATPAGRKFLLWSRFPQFVTQRRGDSIVVTMSDARYAAAGNRSWAGVTVTVPAEPR